MRSVGFLRGIFACSISFRIEYNRKTLPSSDYRVVTANSFMADRKSIWLGPRPEEENVAKVSRSMKYSYANSHKCALHVFNLDTSGVAGIYRLDQHNPSGHVIAGGTQ